MSCRNCTCPECSKQRETKPQPSPKHCRDWTKNCEYRTDVAYGHKDWFVCIKCRQPHPELPQSSRKNTQEGETDG